MGCTSSRDAAAKDLAKVRLAWEWDVEGLAACNWALLNRTLIVAAQRLCVPQLRALPDERVGWVEVYDKVFFFEEWAKARCHTDANESPPDRAACQS
jgi:hypothetical protein